MANGLRRLDGVADVEVDLQRNRCWLRPAPDRAMALAAVPEAVRRAGFRPGRVYVRARGRVEPGGVGALARFRIDGWPAALPLQGELTPAVAAPAAPGEAARGRELVARIAFGPSLALVPEDLPD